MSAPLRALLFTLVPVNDSGYFPSVHAHARVLHVIAHWLDQASPRKYVPVLMQGAL